MLIRVCVVFCLACVWMSAAVHATTIAKMSVAKMSQASSAIARVRCLSNSVIWDSGEIWTLTTFQVQETWRGALPAEITVRLLGGRMAGITSMVSGVPRFRPGEEAVLFLEPASRGHFTVVAWQQGTFRIGHDRATGEETVTQDAAYFPAFDPRTHRFDSRGIVGMTLANFRAQIEAAISTGVGVTK
jgi:hypothetical protein